MSFAIILNFLRSPLGKYVMIGIVVMAMIGSVKWKISSLEGEIEDLTHEKATMTFRNNMCQADIQALEVSVNSQNSKVEDLEKTNRELTIARANLAKKVLSDPVEIDRVVQEGSGPVAMNKFLKEQFGD